MIGVLFVAFLGIKIGAADSSSLAHSGPAYDTLQVLEDGGVTTGALTPIEVLSRDGQGRLASPTTLGEVDGVDRGRRPDRRRRSSVDGADGRRADPRRGDGQLQERPGGPRRHARWPTTPTG